MQRGGSTIISYTWEDDENLRNLTFDIEGTVSRYHPATWESPPEGGCLEEWSVTLTNAEFFDENGKLTRTHHDLTPTEKAALESQFDGLISGTLFDRISESMCDSVDGMYEAALEARAEDRWWRDH